MSEGGGGVFVGVVFCVVPEAVAANLRTKILYFRGFGSSIILMFKGWNSQVHREFPGNVDNRQWRVACALTASTLLGLSGCSGC